MSWTDFYRRRDTIELVLDRARDNREAGMPFDELPAVTEIFTDREDLALALQYKWSQILLGRIAAAQLEADKTAHIDNVEAVTQAWRSASKTNPELRALLDAYADEGGPAFQRAQAREQRMLALAAGLAELREPLEERTRIGAAFQALLRSGERQKTPRLATSS
jgi:hypothetical protein